MYNDWKKVGYDQLRKSNLLFLKLVRKLLILHKFCGRRIMDITPASQAGEYENQVL